MVDPADLLQWGAWRPLTGASRDLDIPPTPGLYCIRLTGRDELDYIGQTGMGAMTLRERLGMLRGVCGELMPYRDPHTTGPALWTLYHQTGEAFEASVVPVEGSTPWRKGLEALAIALYRQAHGAPRRWSSVACRLAMAPRRHSTGPVRCLGRCRRHTCTAKPERHGGW